MCFLPNASDFTRRAEFSYIQPTKCEFVSSIDAYGLFVHTILRGGLTWRDKKKIKWDICNVCDVLPSKCIRFHTTC